MSDQLAAASLLLAFIAILYGLWYPEIVSATKVAVKDQAANRVGDFADVSRVLVRRARPLAVAAVVLALVFAPPALRILSEALHRANRRGWSAVLDYDAVAASLVLVTIFTASFACHLIDAALALGRHRRKIDPRSGDY